MCRPSVGRYSFHRYRLNASFPYAQFLWFQALAYKRGRVNVSVLRCLGHHRFAPPPWAINAINEIMDIGTPADWDGTGMTELSLPYQTRRGDLKILLVICFFFIFLNFRWIFLFRRGQPFDIDEAGYLSISLVYFRSLVDFGFAGWISTINHRVLQHRSLRLYHRFCILFYFHTHLLVLF